MATVEVYIINQTKKNEFDAIPSSGKVPSSFWVDTAVIGGSANGAEPFYLLWWSPWKMMSSIWWDISVYYDPKDSGGQVNGGSGSYTATTPTRKTFAKSSGYYYCMPLKTITNNVATLDATAKAVGNSYATRAADAYRVTVTPWEHWTDGKWYKYPARTLNALYAPITFSGVTVGNLDATDIHADFTVDGWGRMTDKYDVTALTTDGVTYKPIGGKLRAASSMDASTPPVTTIALPRNKFATPPKLVNGDSCDIALSLVMPRLTQNYTLSGTVSVTAITAPRCAIERESNGGVVVYVEAYNNGVSDATVASVALSGAVFGNDIVESELTGVPTETVSIGGVNVACVPFRFPAAPRGAVEYVVTASDPLVGEATVTLTLAASDLAGTLWIIPIDGRDPYALRYNINLSLSADWSSETVQLAGRDRPSAFYGESGDESWSVSWAAPCEDISDGAPTIDTQLAEVRALIEGACITEMPNGDRMLTHVSGLSANRGNNTGLTTFSAKLTEVAG